MEEQDRFREAKLTQLRAEIKRGKNSGGPEPWDSQGVKQQVRARRAAKAVKA